jgi:hypothetical protein
MPLASRSRTSPPTVKSVNARRRLRKQAVSAVGPKPVWIDAPGKNRTCARGLGNAVAEVRVSSVLGAYFSVTTRDGVKARVANLDNRRHP